MLAALIYGRVRFYDPAFRECASGYFCKGEQLHTAVEYRAFRVWQAAVLIGWPIGVGVLIFLQRNRLRAYIRPYPESGNAAGESGFWGCHGLADPG